MEPQKAAAIGPTGSVVVFFPPPSVCPCLGPSLSSRYFSEAGQEPHGPSHGVLYADALSNSNQSHRLSHSLTPYRYCLGCSIFL